MKFKNNFKRFFTLDRHHDAGFTLVELIVVIAILAILAGVAVPAYSGYIKKAEKAGDLQLLGAVNTAFAAAAMENNKKLANLEGTTLGVDASGKIASMTVVEVTVGGVAEDPMFTSFKKFYGANIDTPFKTVKSASLTYGPNGFELPEEGAAANTGLYGQVISDLLSSGKISEETIKALKESEFGKIGAEGLLDKVDLVTGLSNALANGDGVSVLPNQNYQNFLKSHQGKLLKTLTGLTDEELAGMTQAEVMELNQKVQADYEKMITDKMDADDMTRDEAMYSILTNYAVLNAAANTTVTTAKDLGDKISGENALTGSQLKEMMKDSDTTKSSAALGEAAMMYGMYTAWANSLPAGAEKDQAQANASSLDGFINDMNNEAFIAYLQNTEGSAQKDLDGYIAAMDIVNKAGTGNSEAVTNLLMNGFDDDSLQAALEELLQ